jgi:2-dehydropantoate 2-reductase
MHAAPMRLIVLGAGAVGGVVAGRLQRAGCDVGVIARGAHLAAIRRDGLRVESPEEAFTVHPPAFDGAARIDWRAGDVVLLAVKTQDAEAALEDLAAVAPEVPVVCMTNGVAAERLAAERVREVHGACVMMPATHMVPGVVQTWSAPIPGAIDIGRFPDGEDAVDQAVAAALRAAGFTCEVRADVMRWKRGKLLLNLANAAEALSGPPARRGEIIERARAEAIACFDAAGLSRTTEEEEEVRRRGLVSQPIAGAIRAGGSTWQSLARGATVLESEFLNGEIVRLGGQLGIATPVNARLLELSCEAARTGAVPGAMPIDELIARVG